MAVLVILFIRTDNAIKNRWNSAKRRMARRELAKTKKESTTKVAPGVVDKKASCDSSRTHGSKEGLMNMIFASSKEPLRPAMPPILDMKTSHTYSHSQRGNPTPGFSHHPWRIPENSKLLDSLNFLASATIDHHRALHDDQEREKMVATSGNRRRRSHSKNHDSSTRGMHKSSGYSTGSSKYRMVESDADYISDDSELDEDMKVAGSSRRLADFYGMHTHKPSYYPTYNQRYDDNRSYPSTGADYDDDDVISDEEGEDMEIEIFQAIQSLEMLRNSRGSEKSKSDGSKQHMGKERVGSYYPGKPLKKRMKL